MVNLVVGCFLQQWKNEATATTVSLVLLLSQEQLSNCQLISYSHLHKLDILRWIVNAVHFHLLLNVQLLRIMYLLDPYFGKKISVEFLDGCLWQHLVKTLRLPFLCCFPWSLSTVPKWAWFAAMCDWGTYWLTLMTLIGKVGSVSGSLTDWLAWQECDQVAPAYCLGHPINYLLTAMDTFLNACLHRWKTDPSFPSNRFLYRCAVMWLFIFVFFFSIWVAYRFLKIHIEEILQSE